jgi:hypothetical protein
MPKRATAAEGRDRIKLLQQRQTAFLNRRAEVAKAG